MCQSAHMSANLGCSSQMWPPDGPQAPRTAAALAPGSLAAREGVGEGYLEQKWNLVAKTLILEKQMQNRLFYVRHKIILNVDSLI